jgi:chitin synthase
VAFVAQSALTHAHCRPPPKEVKKVDLVQKTEDSYKNLRTNIVLLYAITNGALAIGILGGAGSTFASDGGNTRTSVYMTFLLGSVAGLACELALYTRRGPS